MFHENLTKKTARANEAGKAVVVVLVVLVVAAVGALAYLTTQMDKGQASAETSVATAEPASGETATTEAAATDDADAGTEEAAAEGDADQTGLEKLNIEEGNPVVATVDGKDITRVDVLNFINTLPPQMRQLPLPQLFGMAQQQVINTTIMASKVDEDALAQDEDVQKQLEAAKQQIVRNVFIQREVDKKLTDKRVKAAYADFKKEFEKVEEVKARHILVEDEAAAKELITKLNDGADFAELAKENSIDGTAATGGDLGYFAKTDVVPAFAEVAFDMKPGAYTKEPVQTQFGYHVIEVEEKRERPVPEMEQVKPMLESNLRRTIMEELMKDWRENATVERFDINGDALAEEESN